MCLWFCSSFFFKFLLYSIDISIRWKNGGRRKEYVQILSVLMQWTREVKIMASQTFFDINIHYIGFIFLHNSYHTINEYCLHMIILHIETNT